MARRRRRRRRLRFVMLGAALLGLVGIMSLYRDPTARILERRGELASVEEGPLVPAEGCFDQRNPAHLE